MWAAYVVEWLKLRRSRVPRVTAAALLVLPAVIAPCSWRWLTGIAVTR